MHCLTAQAFSSLVVAILAVCAGIASEEAYSQEQSAFSIPSGRAYFGNQDRFVMGVGSAGYSARQDRPVGPAAGGFALVSDLADGSAWSEEGQGPWFEAPLCGDCPEWTIMPRGLVYSSYLAGAKESRFRTVWNYEKDDGWIWDNTLGGRVGLVRYGSSGDERPTGWQLDIEGAGFPRLDWENSNELISADFRFGVPLTYGTDRYQMKFSYYHLSSHVGDEFLIRNPGFTRLNYSRDVLVLGYSYTPHDDLRFYAEAGWAFYSDVGDPWEFQFGVDYLPGGCTGIRGAPFAALNGHLREELDFGGNLVAQAGWAWRSGPTSGLFRVGAEYYNGRDDQFSFVYDFQSKVGVGLWYDY